MHFKTSSGLKLVLLSYMDTRHSNLLPRAMNLNNAEASSIKNAGADVTHPFGREQARPEAVAR